MKCLIVLIIFLILGWLIFREGCEWNEENYQTK